MEKCDLTLRDLMDEIKALRQELAAHQEDFHSAFPLNTIGKPDIDGHRTSHENQINSAKNLEVYKTKVVEKILLAGVTGLLAVFGFGFGPYVQDLIIQFRNYVGVAP